MIKKHVIFLGAGASATSGYPLADRLRFILSSRKHYVQYVSDCINARPDLGTSVQWFLDRFDEIAPAIDLFRHGGFATVDEFSFLAWERYPKEVNALKRLMRLVLALHDPEINFEKSEYYGFIQRLFEPDLHQLRNDVAVFTFNYDPYLDYLLLRSYTTRKEATGQNPDTNVCGCLTGGWYSRNLEYIRTSFGFFYGKLHGSAVFPSFSDQAPAYAHQHIFSPEGGKHVGFAEQHYGHLQPPLLFPWELPPLYDGFKETDFRIRDEEMFAGKPPHAPSANVAKLFESVWRRAEREVAGASRISFVGLSMHPYLEKGFEFIFGGRCGRIAKGQLERRDENATCVDLVIANPEAVKRDLDGSELSKHTTEVVAMIRKYAPGLSPRRRSSGERTVTTYATFAEFISKEMKPLASDEERLISPLETDTRGALSDYARNS
jgi:hypothetical protein